MTVDPDRTGEHPEPARKPGPDPALAVICAAVSAAVAGYFTDWETAVTVFHAVISLFTTSRRE